VIVFAKNEGNNLRFMVIALQFMIDCEPLKLLQIYEGICFGLWCLKRANMQQMMIRFLWV
jgi:hypothetical protein